ncbi:MAG: FapA family protein [bacterium]|nr:FapA family protein [bacterium]
MDERLKALEDMEDELSRLERELEDNGDSLDIDEKIKAFEDSLRGIKTQYVPTIDGKAEVEISEDQLKAYLTVTSPKIGGKEASLKEVKEELAGLVEVDEARIRHIVENKEFDKKFLIAEGIPPGIGEDAYLSYKLQGEKVVPGQILAVKVPATCGKPGISVTGDEIPGKTGDDFQLIPGRNVSLSRDGVRAYATDFGRVNWVKDKVNVERCYKVMGSANRKLGDIEFAGKVSIEGDVSDININANSIEVKKGVVNAKLKAKEDIVVKSCKDSELTAEGNVLIKDDLVGGKVFANSIQARTIGGREGVETHISVKDKISASTIHKGVRIEIYKERLLIKDKKDNITFHIEDGKIKGKEYEEITLEEGIPIERSRIDFTKSPPSIVISSDLSIEKAKLLLGVNEEVKIKEEGDKIRVFPSSAKSFPWEEEVTVDIIVEEPKDGHFEFQNTQDGLYLIVSPPIGKGERVSLEKVREEIKRRDFVGVDDKRVAEVVNKSNGEKMKVAERQYDHRIDSSISIELSKDLTSATMTIAPPKKGGRLLNLTHLMKALDKEGIVAGIDKDALTSISEKVEITSPITIMVAKASLPTKGEDARFSYRYEGKAIVSQLLAVKEPPSLGKPGVNVKGEEIPAELGEDFEIKVDKNVFLSEDGLRAYSCVDGWVSWEENKVSVVGEIGREFDPKKDPPSVVIPYSSIEEGKKEGAHLLGLPIEKVDYREMEEGKIRIVPSDLPGPWDEKGSFKFVNTREGLFLQVLPPKGKGERVKEEEVLKEIEDMKFEEIDYKKLKDVVDECSGKEILIGPRQFIPGIDSQVVVEISSDKKKANITITPPKPEGLEVTFQEVIEILRKNKVSVGIKEDVIKEAIDKKQFNTSILVAEAIEPIPGKDGYIDYRFKTDQEKIRLLEDEQGRIDFRELNKLENVKAGQLLAVKFPPSLDGGKEGLLVTGEVIPVPLGKEARLIGGKNTMLSNDKQKLYSNISGQPILVGDRVSVEPVYEIKGDVNMGTGNIHFLGTVIIEGSVFDGFKVEAEGDIKIRDSVGRATLFAKGNITIGVGVQGGRVFSGGDIIAKFVDGSELGAKENIIIGEEVLHSELNAGKSITVFGKRGSIIGGHITAGEEVTSRRIGSSAFTKTKIKVGADPKTRQEIQRLEKVLSSEIRHLERIRLDIKTLERIGQERGLTDEEKRRFDKLIKLRDILSMKLRSYSERQEILNTQILCSTGGRVNVAEICFPGVSILIKSASLMIKNDPIEQVTFVNEAEEVKIKGYNPSK